jgi:putative ABC transport system permease protein
VLSREAVIVGVLSTIVGVTAGAGVLGWILDSLASRTLRDFAIERTVAPPTLVIAALVGVVSVSLAPLFLIRRIRRMDLPDTLRVME